MNEGRTLMLAVGLASVLGFILLAALVAAHERHYAKRSLFLLTRRVEAIAQLLREDRMV